MSTIKKHELKKVQEHTYLMKNVLYLITFVLTKEKISSSSNAAL
jgi:hypothetical protein